MNSFPSAPPSVQRLAGLCGPAACGIALEVVAETGSTNADLLARAARQELAGATLLWALRQTAGRGR
ncbi:MAG TPA: biotin--[acetyl-CoA-carboxylase] ligase, partial [Oxalicibacterium sp.]|nr:biotin--[acetyl-CoA-carboxylase] ligase [Oxalicibacterium sp.]